MRIGFLVNQITIRGDCVNLYDYAHYNETILGNESIIISRPYEEMIRLQSRFCDQDTYKKFADRFKLEYYIHPVHIQGIVERNKIDVLFIEKAGSSTDGLVFDFCKTIIHAVFTTKEPHGTLYSSISDSLNKICETSVPVLPYMVRVYDTQETLHEELQIPKDALVFGSYGGKECYSLEYVKQAVRDIVNSGQHPNIYFIYMYHDPFMASHPNVRFLPGSTDMKRKRMFINTCDAMLYAREGGETFGLATGEFSLCDKPVIARSKEHSCAHIDILGSDLIGHSSYEEVYKIITNWDTYKKDVSQNGYKHYTPECVMEIFKEALAKL
jgi:protein tyrosine phosphatase (PTP) superfamily phosphohydrolase (DUF442 family)